MGSGECGNYYGTKGSTPPIKKNGDIRYSDKKFVEYLLNNNHPEGGSKAKFFNDTLGYNQENSKELFDSIVKSIKGAKPTKTITTPYGVKHNFKVEIEGAKGIKTKANVVVVVQKDKRRITYKIVTVYPDGKEK